MPQKNNVRGARINIHTCLERIVHKKEMKAVVNTFCKFAS